MGGLTLPPEREPAPLPEVPSYSGGLTPPMKAGRAGKPDVDGLVVDPYDPQFGFMRQETGASARRDPLSVAQAPPTD